MRPSRSRNSRGAPPPAKETRAAFEARILAEAEKKARMKIQAEQEAETRIRAESEHKDIPAPKRRKTGIGTVACSLPSRKHQYPATRKAPQLGGQGLHLRAVWRAIAASLGCRDSDWGQIQAEAAKRWKALPAAERQLWQHQADVRRKLELAEGTPVPAVRRTSAISADDPELQEALRVSADMAAQSERAVADARARLGLVMQKFKAKVRPIKADGNCQFRAVAHQLYGDEEQHAKIRSETVERLTLMQEHYCGFVNEPYQKYLSRMACDGIFGYHMTLQAASDNYERAIHVLNDQPGSERTTIHPLRDRHPPLWLALITDWHYDAAEFE